MKTPKVFFYSFILALLYVTSVNSFFISFLEYEFNPSKLIFLFLLPFIFMHLNRFKFRNTDIFFLFFLLFLCLRLVFIFNLEYLTSLTNILFPFIAYKFFQNKLDYLNLKFIIYSILFIAAINCTIGLGEFFTGDKLFALEDLREQEFKLNYARNFGYNPFSDLERLPQAMFNYSSVLAISLILPLFTLVSYQKKINQFWYYLMLIAFSFTIFVTFSRMELLALFFIFALRHYVIIRDKINKSRLLIVFLIGVSVISSYIIFTTDTIGTLGARVISLEMLSKIFQTPVELFFGGDITLLETSDYGDIPHNIFIFSHYNYGALGGFFIIGYFMVTFLYYSKFYKKYMSSTQSEFKTVFMYLTIFYFYDLFIRGFTYYILDGYQNIFSIFFVQILLELIIYKFKREQSEDDLYNNTVPQS